MVLELLPHYESIEKQQKYYFNIYFHCSMVGINIANVLTLSAALVQSLRQRSLALGVQKAAKSWGSHFLIGQSIGLGMCYYKTTRLP